MARGQMLVMGRCGARDLYIMYYASVSLIAVILIVAHSAFEPISLRSRLGVSSTF